MRQIKELDIDKGLLIVTGRNMATRSCRWVLPPKGLEEQVRKIHQGMAHPGRDRLTRVAKKYVLGLELSQICKKVVLECEKCQRTTDAITQNETRMAPNKAAIPWESLSIDVMTLPFTKGFQYILVASDNASSFTWATPMPRQDAKSIIQRLDDTIFSQHGSYKEINFNGVSQLTGTAMQQMLRIIDTRGIQVLVSRKNSNRAERDIARIRNGL